MTALLTPDRQRSRPAGTSSADRAVYQFHRPTVDGVTIGSAARTASRSSQHPAFGPTGRPSLVVIEGGRSPAAVAHRRTYTIAQMVVGAVAAIVVAVLLWGLLSLGSPPASHPLGTAPHITSTRYLVRPGDSLWGIATALHRGGDVRDVVDRLAQVNGSATVFAGQAITIPADLLK
jgi:hypothetical protein